MRLSLPVHRLVLLDGRRRMGAAALAGAASALAMPPYDLWPILFLTLPALVLLLDGTGGGRLGVRDAAWTGFGFGFGYFLSGLWWIGAAFFVPGDTYQWLMPFAVIGLPLVLAVFHAAGCALARALWSNGPARVLALAFGLGAGEWLRGHALTGFPWNELGYALANNPWLGQAASVFGVEGLTVIAIAIFAMPATLNDGGGAPWRGTACAVAVLAALATFGATRLTLAGEAQTTGLKLRIMQPNIAQDDKFRISAKDAIMARYLALSDRATSPEQRGMADADLLIWPESAFPFFLGRTPDALAQIGALLPEGKVLLTGAARLEDGETLAERRIYNSVHALADDGSIIASYDKVHLVPGGEFLPFQSALESIGLRQLTRLPGGFTPGEKPHNIILPSGLKLAPLVCYEAIFPTGAYDSERADALLNVTNDGWFGDTPGPRQHFAQARARAVEQGLPLIRAANTGISAIVDPWGRVLASLPLGVHGVLDAEMVAALPPTLYNRYGFLLVAGLYLATIVGVFLPRLRV